MSTAFNSWDSFAGLLEAACKYQRPESHSGAIVEDGRESQTGVTVPPGGRPRPVLPPRAPPHHPGQAFPSSNKLTFFSSK